MRIIAIVDAGRASEEYYREYIARARQTSGAENVLVVTEGDVARTGGLPPTDKYVRTETFLRAGADAVLEMPLPGTLLVDNLFAFAVVALLRKVGCVDFLAVPCPAADRAVLEATAKLLFNEPPAYRRRMIDLRDNGGDLEALLPGVAEEFAPGAERFLSRPRNRLAVEYLNALKRSYSTVKPCPLDLPEPPEEADPFARDAFLLSRVRDAFLARPERETLRWAGEICSDSERMALRLRRLLEETRDGACPEAGVFWAACADMNPAAARRYLTCCLAGYRKVDSFVCITYNYVPYLKVLGGKAPLLERLREKAGTTFLLDTPEARDFSQATDFYKQRLLDMDARMRALWLEGAQSGTLDVDSAGC